MVGKSSERVIFMLKIIEFFKSKGNQVPQWKYTSGAATVKCPGGPYIHLMLSQHTGAPCEPVVHVGDYIHVGQLVAQSKEFISAPIHGSVSGIIEEITPDKIIIKSDGKETIDPSIIPPVIESEEDFIQAVRRTGLLSLEEKGYPTIIKLKKKEKNNIDTLIINAAECEPFITTDTREIIENTLDVLEGILALSNYLQVKSIIIGIEEHNEEAINVLEGKIAADKRFNQIKIKKLYSEYPQGAERIIITSCTGRRLEEGQLPSEVGVVVSNISSIGFLGRYIKTGRPLVSRRVTLDGGGIKEPKNILAPIGTLVSDLVQCGGGYISPQVKILSGGPMMGVLLKDDSEPITKRTNGVTLLSSPQGTEKEEIACIRCSRCVNHCPMNLLPYLLDQQVREGEIEELKELNIRSCIKCGKCSFVCPSNREIVKNIRIGLERLDQLEKES
jgi:electron transport complex protein RnfC